MCYLCKSSGRYRCYNCGSGPFVDGENNCQNCRAPRKYQDNHLQQIKDESAKAEIDKRIQALEKEADYLGMKVSKK